VRRLLDALVAAAVLLFARLRLGRPREERPRLVPPPPPGRGAARAVTALLAAAMLCAAAFPVIYALDRLPRQTQLLGLALGLAFVFLAAALGVAGMGLVPQEQLEEQYPLPHEHDQEEVVQLVEEGGEAFTRRRLLVLTAGGAGTALAVALVTPALSLGPALDSERLRRGPWRAGRRLVDADGRPIRASSIAERTFSTAFPADAPRERLDAPVVVVRLEAAQLDLPAGREAWAPNGIVAYSKICTHAGCAVSEYRVPLYEPTAPRPALVCPCHYSTFDPATGGAVLFGPAGRPLPQLPLDVDAEGYLVAAGAMSGPIGPSWWGVRLES
jgi:ubiquinol-cytochrome c reductase iron-sulfur subunit